MFTLSFTSLRHQLGHDRPRDDRPLWQRRLSSASTFCQSLVGCRYLTEAQMLRAAQRYRLGTSRDGAVIFWQIDDHDVIRDGKLMYYRDDCHRDHDRHPTWISFLLRQSGKLPDDWKPEHCLFGLHLLKHEEKNDLKNEKVAIVESEKTAVIMSELRPECLWMATGGKTELTVAKLQPLSDCRIILFPDTDTTGQTYRDWYDIAQSASDVFGHPVSISSLLEQHASPSQKTAKIDIVDYFNNE